MAYPTYRDDHPVRALSRLVAQINERPEALKGSEIYREELRHQAEAAPTNKATLEALIRSGDAKALTSFLQNADLDKLRVQTGSMSIPQGVAMPAANVLDVLNQYQIKLSSWLFGYRILEYGFISNDPDYARRAVEQFDLPAERIISAIPSLITLSSPHTASYLAELMTRTLRASPPLRAAQLMSVAWGDACPKLMSCLVWLGLAPHSSAQMMCPSGLVGDQMRSHAASLSSAHDVIELHHTYPRLSDVITSDLPITLLPDEAD